MRIVRGAFALSLLGLAGLGAAAALGGGWLIWRAQRGARLPGAGLLPVWLLGLLAAALSTFLSPDPRPALERLAWLAGEVQQHLPGFFGVRPGGQRGLDGLAHITGADRFQGAGNLRQILYAPYAEPKFTS